MQYLFFAVYTIPYELLRAARSTGIGQADIRNPLRYLLITE